MISSIISSINPKKSSLIENDTFCFASTMVGYRIWPVPTTYIRPKIIINKITYNQSVFNIIHHLSIKVVVIKLSLAPSRTEMKCVFCGSELGNDIVDLYGIKAHRSCFEKKLHQYLEVKANE